MIAGSNRETPKQKRDEGATQTHGCHEANRGANAGEEQTLPQYQPRVHFEAVAVAFISTGLTALLWGYLQKADILGPVNVGLVLVPMTVLYCVGYVVAARHYK